MSDYSTRDQIEERRRKVHADEREAVENYRAVLATKPLRNTDPADFRNKRAAELQREVEEATATRAAFNRKYPPGNSN